MIQPFKKPAKGALLHCNHDSIYTAKVFHDTLNIETLYNNSFSNRVRTSFIKQLGDGLPLHRFFI